MLPGRCCLDDKLTALFKLCHARCYGGLFWNEFHGWFRNHLFYFYMRNKNKLQTWVPRQMQNSCVWDNVKKLTCTLRTNDTKRKKLICGPQMASWPFLNKSGQIALFTLHGAIRTQSIVQLKQVTMHDLLIRIMNSTWYQQFINTHQQCFFSIYSLPQKFHIKWKIS